MQLLWLRGVWYRWMELARWYSEGYRFIRQETGVWECFNVNLRQAYFGRGKTKDLAKADLAATLDSLQRVLFGASRRLGYVEESSGGSSSRYLDDSKLGRRRHDS